MKKGNRKRAITILLIILCAIIALFGPIRILVGLILLYDFDDFFPFFHIVDRSVIEQGNSIYWNDQRYIAADFKYDKLGPMVAKVKDTGWRVCTIPGDTELRFLVTYDFLCERQFVNESYEIPQSGTITAVYIDGQKIENETLCYAIGQILGGSGETFEIETGVIYQLAKDIVLSYEGCPVGTEFIGYIGYIQDEWVFIDKNKTLRNDNWGEPDGTSIYICQIIDDQYIPILRSHHNYPNYSD